MADTEVLVETAPPDGPPVPDVQADPPLDQVIPPDPTPPTENYHVSLWDTPMTYVCLRCAAKRLSEADVQTHVQLAHNETPVPTPLAANPVLSGLVTAQESTP